MADARRPILPYANGAPRVVRRGGNGFFSFVVALLLSPVVVLGAVWAYFSTQPEPEDPLGVGLMVVVGAMLGAVLIPAIALIAGNGDRTWPAAGLIISIVGWGTVVLLVLRLWASHFW